MTKTLKKAIVLLLALTMSLVIPGHCFAAGDASEKDIEAIFRARMENTGAGDLQELVWYYADNAGQGEEWYVLSLRQQYPGQFDLSEYRKAYSRYAETISEKSYTTRLKAALIMQALGESGGFIDRTADGAIGQAGVMSWIYGLHVLNNGAQSKFTKDAVIDELLALQLADGGWAVMGDNGDVDVTAMAVQALAPHYGSERVKTALDKAVALLAQRQKDSGYFSSFGDDNPESAAQVLVALSSLGIDCTKDERFIKGGRTVLDIIASFKTADGEYAHVLGGSANDSAAVQTLYSLVSYDMMLKGKGSLYLFGEFSEPHVERPEKQPSGGGTNSDRPDEPEKDTEKQGGSAKSLKPLLYGITAAAAVISCAVLLLLKKRSYKSYLFVIILAVIAAAGITFIDIERPSDYYGGGDAITDPLRTEIYISAATVAGEASHIPADGIILQRTEITVNKGQTALDQLISAARAASIQLQLNSGYVAGIANVFELDYGDLSGWMYRINGEFASVNSSEYVLKEGDLVEWLYTRNIGKDIGNEYTGK